MTPDKALATAQRLYGELINRRPAVCAADDYYRGKQPLKFASDKWREYHAARYDKFSDNWCAPVANSPSERLRVDGFRLDDDPKQSPDEAALWRDWELNNLPMQSSQGFLASIVGARSFVLVWGNKDNEPVATWERPDQMIVGYDVEQPGVRVAALKSWCDEEERLEYATLYTPDEVWKWQRPYTPSYGRVGNIPPGSRGYEFFAQDSGLIAPVANDRGWVPRDGADPNPMKNPLGLVPVVEFANRPMLGGDPLSDIAGTAAMQDAINLLWAYLFTAADFASMPARVVMGQEPPKIPVLNEAGDVVGMRDVDMKKIAEDRILWLTGQSTKIDQWDAAKLDVFTSTIEVCVTHVAAQTRTPPHYLVLGKGMVNVNADGMKAAEIGLVMKVGEEQLYFGAGVREVFRLFALVRDNKAIAEKCRLGTVQWKDAENRSEAQLVDALAKLSGIGFPFEWIVERYGLSQTEVARLLAMKEREQANNPSLAIARAVTGAGAPAAKPPAPAKVPAGATA
jgi:hypothetical protein